MGGGGVGKEDSEGADGFTGRNVNYQLKRKVGSKGRGERDGTGESSSSEKTRVGEKQCVSTRNCIKTWGQVSGRPTARGLKLDCSSKGGGGGLRCAGGRDWLNSEIRIAQRAAQDFINLETDGEKGVGNRCK